MTKKLNNKRAWTKEEDDTIRRLYPTHLQKQIASVLNRPEGSVATRISTLGLISKTKQTARAKGAIVRPCAGVLIHYSTFTRRAK